MIGVRAPIGLDVLARSFAAMVTLACTLRCLSQYFRTEPSKEAARKYRSTGLWLEGRHWRTDPANRIVYNRATIEVAGRPSVKQPIGMPKRPTGVEINGEQLRISFMLNGQRCREGLPGIVKINKASIVYADNKRRTILAEIKEGRFDYVARFPESPRALLFSGVGGPNTRRTVAESISRWLEVMRARKAESTVINYASKAKRVEQKFGAAGLWISARAIWSCSRRNY